MVGSKAPGGAETFALRLIEALSKRNDVEILTLVRRGGWLNKQLVARRFAVGEVAFSGWWDVVTRWRAAGMVRDFGADVVQSWMNRATLFVPKGPWATVGRLGGFYDLKYYRGRVENLVGNTQAICDYCVAQGWPKDRVKMISNFVARPAEGWRDGREAVRRELKLGARDCALVIAGRLHRVKGVDIALRALAQLPENCVLVLVGEGPLREELKALAVELGVAGRVRWVGWTNDMSRYAAAADIWLAPSRYEPLGNTVLDAWVHEVPVVASKVGGLAMLVEDGKTGLLVEKEDVDGLAAAVGRLVKDKALRKLVVAGATARFDKEFAEEVIVGQYVAYYRSLVEEKQRG
jgi:glycosyltransferase involved in cell wall biosynthesis